MGGLSGDFGPPAAGRAIKIRSKRKRGRSTFISLRDKKAAKERGDNVGRMRNDVTGVGQSREGHRIAFAHVGGAVADVPTACACEDNFRRMSARESRGTVVDKKGRKNAGMPKRSPFN